MAVVRLDLNNMCRHAAFYEQIGADLEVVKWVRNGYELKLKEWPQDSFTKNNIGNGGPALRVARTKKVQLSRYLETGTW